MPVDKNKLLQEPHMSLSKELGKYWNWDVYHVWAGTWVCAQKGTTGPVRQTGLRLCESPDSHFEVKCSDSYCIFGESQSAISSGLMSAAVEKEKSGAKSW